MPSTIQAPNSPVPRRVWIPSLVLVSALLLTGLATSYVARSAGARDRLRFERAVRHTQDSIQNRLETYITDFEPASRSGAALLTLLVGLLISGLLFGITRYQVEARAAAERSAAELLKSEEELRWSEGRQAAIVAAALDAAITIDH